MEETLSKWHQFVETRDISRLDEILADEVKFHSPFIWKPKEGIVAAKMILAAVITVFEDFRYVREIRGERDAMLQFAARVGDLELRGVDILAFGDDKKIVDFEVMIRPGNALLAVSEEMRKRL